MNVSIEIASFSPTITRNSSSQHAITISLMAENTCFGILEIVADLVEQPRYFSACRRVRRRVAERGAAGAGAAKSDRPQFPAVDEASTPDCSRGCGNARAGHPA